MSTFSHFTAGRIDLSVRKKAAAVTCLPYIDCDWYDPVMYCFTAIASPLAVGGAILLDDYHDYGGCKTATDEFLAQRDDFRMEDGRNVILRKFA